MVQGFRVIRLQGLQGLQGLDGFGMVGIEPCRALGLRFWDPETTL